MKIRQQNFLKLFVKHRPTNDEVRLYELEQFKIDLKIQRIVAEERGLRPKGGSEDIDAMDVSLYLPETAKTLRSDEFKAKQREAKLRSWETRRRAATEEKKT